MTFRPIDPNHTLSVGNVEINDALQNLSSMHRGNTAPTATEAGMYWLDTSGTNPVIRLRNIADDAWLFVFELNSRGVVNEFVGGYEFTGGFDGKSVDSTTITADVDDSVTTIPVANDAIFTAGGGRAILGGSEIILYTAAGSGQLTGVTRGAYGSTASAHTNGDDITDAQYVWDTSAGINYTSADVAAGTWKRFSLSREIHLATDIPYWTDPTPLNHVDKGMFGGQHLPTGVTSLLDFNFDWGTIDAGSTDTGSLKFDECKTGDLLNCRFDFEVIPQVANTTVEVALWWVTRNPSTLAETFSFALTTSPIFYGTGTVGNAFLNRPTISAYFASNEDTHAVALPAIKSDNPVIIRPHSMLTTIIR